MQYMQLDMSRTTAFYFLHFSTVLSVAIGDLFPTEKCCKPQRDEPTLSGSWRGGDASPGPKSWRILSWTGMEWFIPKIPYGMGENQDLGLRFVPEEALEFDPLNREKPWMVIGTKCDMLHRDPLPPGCITWGTHCWNLPWSWYKLVVFVNMAVENINFWWNIWIHME